MNSYEDILKRLTDYKKTHENHLTLLEKVNILSKKDGTHFKNINQNFENGKVVTKYISSQYFTMYGRDEKGNFIDFDFDVTDNTVDEIIQKIENIKQTEKNHIEEYERQINASKKVFDIVDKKVQEISDIIVEETKEFRTGKYSSPSSLQYAIEEYVQNKVKYLR